MRSLRKNIYHLERSQNPILRGLLRLILAFYRMVDRIFLKRAEKLDRSAEKVVSHDRKFCCVIVPKCASRTLINGIATAGRDKGFSHRIAETGIAGFVDNYEEYFRFTFVRDPWARAYSCYKQKIFDYTPIKEALHFTGRKGLYRGMSFRNFVLWLDSHEGRDDCADRHWASQYLILGIDLGMQYDFIGKLETIDRDLKTVAEQLSIATNSFASTANRSARKGEYIENYDEELIGIIQRRYSRDIELFGYQPPQLGHYDAN